MTIVQMALTVHCSTSIKLLAMFHRLPDHKVEVIMSQIVSCNYILRGI